MSQSVKMIAAAVATTLAFGLQPAMAQEKEGAEILGVETVVVTSQRRSEDAQRVPLTVKALDSQALAQQNITDISDLADAVPGFAVQKVGGFHRPVLRGMGIQSSGSWQEALVSTYVDGVYIVDPFVNSSILNNLERVEVIKGPQGTLFGRNSVGGVISYVTRDPSPEPSLDAAFGYGNYDSLSGSLYGTTGITDTVAVNIALVAEDQRDGWGRNLYTGHDLHDGSRYSARSKLAWTPNDSTRIILSADWSHSDSLDVGSNTARGIYPFIVRGPLPVGGFYDMYSPSDSQVLNENYGGSLTVSFDRGWVQFLSITAWRSSTVESATPDPFDVPFLPETPQVGQVASLRTFSDSLRTNRTVTQEFQVLSPDSSRVKWVGGVYVLKDVSGMPRKYDTRLVSNGILSTGINTRQDTDSYSAFAEATWPLLAATRLTTGVRYTVDEKNVSGYGTRDSLNNPGVFTITPGSRHEDNPVPGKKWSRPTYKVALEHDLGADALVYATFSTGFQSGFYPITNNASAPPLEPMTIRGLELGVKSEFLDNRLRINAAVFNYDLQNVVVSNFFNGSQNQRNAAESRIRGLDFDLTLRPFGDLTLTAAAQLLDARYMDYQNAIVFVPSPTANTYSVTSQDLTGQRLQWSEKFQGSAAANYRIASNVGDFLLAGAVIYHSGTQYDAQDLNTHPPYTLVNASVGWTSLDDTWDVKLWAKNLTDREYGTLQVGSLNKYTPSEPRTYGVSIGYRWN